MLLFVWHLIIGIQVCLQFLHKLFVFTLPTKYFSLVDLIDPSVYPEFVLAIHSSKRLLVEQVAPPSFVLADTIINLTLAKGKRHEVSNCCIV